MPPAMERTYILGGVEITDKCTVLALPSLLPFPVFEKAPSFKRKRTPHGVRWGGRASRRRTPQNRAYVV